MKLLILLKLIQIFGISCLVFLICYYLQERAFNLLIMIKITTINIIKINVC